MRIGPKTSVGPEHHTGCAAEYLALTGLFFKFASQRMPARSAGLLAQHKYKLNATNIIKVAI
jgi:hypothetical protein